MDTGVDYVANSGEVLDLSRILGASRATPGECTWDGTRTIVINSQMVVMVPRVGVIVHGSVLNLGEIILESHKECSILIIVMI